MLDIIIPAAAFYGIGYILKATLFKETQPSKLFKWTTSILIFLLVLVALFMLRIAYGPSLVTASGEATKNPNLFHFFPAFLSAYLFIKAVDKKQLKDLTNLDPSKYKPNKSLEPLTSNTLLENLKSNKYSPNMKEQVIIELQVRGYKIDKSGNIFDKDGHVQISIAL